MSKSCRSPNKSQKDIEHQFWLWEYQRRNSDFRKAYNDFMEKLKEDSLSYSDLSALSESKSSKFTEKDWAAFHSMIAEKKIFIEKYNRGPKDYKTGIDSEKLLNDIDHDVFEFPSVNIEKILMRTKILNSDWPYLTVQIDLKENLNHLIKELSAIYYQYHLINNPGDRNRYTFLLTEAKSLKNEMLKSQTGSKQGKKRNYPRAVGLWIWDRYNFKSKIRGAKYGIYEKYRSRYDNKSKPDKYYTKAYEEDAHLDRLLRITNKCIEMMKVLPMKQK